MAVDFKHIRDEASASRNSYPAGGSVHYRFKKKGLMASSKLGFAEDLIFAAVFAFATIGAYGSLSSAHMIDRSATVAGISVGLTGLFMKRLGRFQAACAPTPPRALYFFSSWEAQAWDWLEPRGSFVAACRNGLLAMLAVALIAGLTALFLHRLEWGHLLSGCVLVGIIVAGLGVFASRSVEPRE